MLREKDKEKKRKVEKANELAHVVAVFVEYYRERFRDGEERKS